MADYQWNLRRVNALVVILRIRTQQNVLEQQNCKYCREKVGHLVPELNRVWKNHKHNPKGQNESHVSPNIQGPKIKVLSGNQWGCWWTLDIIVAKIFVADGADIRKFLEPLDQIKKAEYYANWDERSDAISRIYATDVDLENASKYIHYYCYAYS